jgi:pyruvate-formate lyase
MKPKNTGFTKSRRTKIMISGNTDSNWEFARELRFTETYKKYMHAHIAIREAMCLREQFPEIFSDMQAGDLFAGRIKYGLFGFGLEQPSGGRAGYGFTCEYEQVIKRIEESGIDAGQRAKILDAVQFWNDKESIRAKLLKKLPDGLPAGDTRLAGVFIDYEKLIALGLPGLMDQVEQKRKQALADGKDDQLFEGMLMALRLFSDVCVMYSEQAKKLADTAGNEKQMNELKIASDVLQRITHAKPATLREAIQLTWLYSLISGVINYGRMDVYFGDFYVNDIDTGLLSEKEALELLKSLWQLIADRKIVFNSRVIIGGKGRKNERNANRFAMAAMEATRLIKETEPQLSLRFYEGMDPLLMEKALDVIGEGRIYPMLYNDDVNIPSVQNTYSVSTAEAEQYLPYGCGEYAIDHKSLNSPNCAFNLLKILEYTMHNGRDGLTGNLDGLQTGEFSSFATFDDLFSAYKKQVDFILDYYARKHVLEYEVERENTCYLFVSALFDQCLERGKSIVNGGAQHLGGLAESFAIVNAGDSLAAIKQLVYEKKLFTKEQLLAMLDADFAGFERERQIFLNVPKYGNDDDYVDEIVMQVSDQACKSAEEAGKKAGLEYFRIVNINNFVSVVFGKITAASADGRKAGDPLANGNAPTAGRDKAGVTAFLNSIAKLDPSNHAGYVQNMKFSKQLFTEQRGKLKSLLDVYFAKGGTQAMITVVNKGDLEEAMREPEKHSNLIVRVGGFSARFVELDRDQQLDILHRTLY